MLENKELERRILELVKLSCPTGEIHHYAEMIDAIIRLANQNPTATDICLFHCAISELSAAQKVFGPYGHKKKICVFGSARTGADAAEFKAAAQFAKRMTELGFMVMTGGGNGIMGAAQLGAGKELSFGLNIELPFEQHANSVIEGDPKLVSFKYFFTRKLNFIKESHAIALFPGGFGTLDEGFEILTLLQTGKRQLVPIVMIDVPGGAFWQDFLEYLQNHLQKAGLISPSDFCLFKVTQSLDEACEEVVRFYRNFHSYRFTSEKTVLYLQRPIPPEEIPTLEKQFSDLLRPQGRFGVDPSMEDEEYTEDLQGLSKLAFNFDNRSFGRLRALIDRINEY